MLHEAKRRAPIHLKPEDMAAGRRLLKEAQADHIKRQAVVDGKIADYSHEASSYFRNRVLGAVSVIGGIGEGKTFGPGRYKYRIGKGWEKVN